MKVLRQCLNNSFILLLTKDVLAAAARNEDSGKGVIALLPEKRGSDVQITVSIVRTAASTPFSGKDIMAMLLEQAERQRPDHRGRCGRDYRWL
jgi:hypothetical protein